MLPGPRTLDVEETSQPDRSQERVRIVDSIDTPKLTVVRTEPQPCHLRLAIPSASRAVNKAWGKAVALFQKSARVPGFRAGKTPSTLLLRRYQKEIQEEAKSQLIQDAVKEACEQEKLTPETSPRLEDEGKLTLWRTRPSRLQSPSMCPPRSTCLSTKA